jgi:type IV pilus assembly protein PilX
MRVPMRSQQGVALIVALVMLVVIGFTSIAIMRGSLNSDMVANNARVQNFAMQAAQLGLRYCESQIDLPEADRVVDLHPEYMWENFDNWFGSSAKAVVVPDDVLKTANSSITPNTRPQCLVEATGIAGGQSYYVTARGFSPDFSADSKGRTKTGSVVWLQSTVALGSSGAL